MTFLLAFSLAFVGVAGGALWAVGAWEPEALRLRFSEPYHFVTELARRDPAIGENLGAIRGFGWLPKGDLSISGREGWCEIEVWVRGEVSEGRLEARLERRGGRWFWSWANLRLADGQLLSLAV